MSFVTAIKRYGLLGIFRRLVCIVIGHDYFIGKCCLHCNDFKSINRRVNK